MSVFERLISTPSIPSSLTSSFIYRINSPTHMSCPAAIPKHRFLLSTSAFTNSRTLPSTSSGHTPPATTVSLLASEFGKISLLDCPVIAGSTRLYYSGLRNNLIPGSVFLDIEREWGSASSPNSGYFEVNAIVSSRSRSLRWVVTRL